MKRLIVTFLITCPCLSYAGYFIEKSMYVETYIAVGKGRTLKEARRDALEAIPRPTKWTLFEENGQWNSPAYQCIGGGVWSEKNECFGGEIQYILPLRKIEQ